MDSECEEGIIMKRLETYHKYDDSIHINFGGPPELFELQIGYALVDLVTKEELSLKEEIQRWHKQIDAEYGLVLPRIHIRDNMCLEPNEYAILFKGVELGKATIFPGFYYCFDTGSVIPNGIDKSKYQKYVDPCFGLEGFRVEARKRLIFEKAGYVCVTPHRIISTHLCQITQKNLTKILTQCMVNELTEKVRESNPEVFTDVFFKKQFSLSDMKILLNSLLEEHISIRDMNTIMETIADYLLEERNPLKLEEKVRVRLVYSFIKQYEDDNSVVHVVKISESLSNLLYDNVYYPESKIEPPDISLEPEMRKKIVAKIAESIKEITDNGYPPVILCISSLRLPLKNFIRRLMPGVEVISDTEIMALNGKTVIKLEGELSLE